MEYKEHKVHWDDIKIERFWRAQHRNPAFEDNYFTKQVGDALLQCVLKHTQISGKILDYGTGRGHLIEHILRKNLGDVTACDFSEESVSIVNEKFKNCPAFKGCAYIDKLPSQLKTASFDCLFIVETIEHLTEEAFDSAFKEIGRIMKQGASLIVTTRNNENLDLTGICCPECGAIFHRVQHIRSFTSALLKNLVESYGFEVTFCEAVNLGDYKRKSLVRRIANCIPHPSAKSQPPDLICIAQKTDSGNNQSVSSTI